MLECKPSETPIDQNKRPKSLDDKAPIEKGRFQRLVGRFIYLSHTHQDTTFAVSRVSQHMHSPTKSH